MGYVGNAPAEKYTTIDKQTLTGNNTVGPYTLTHSVGNEQEIEVFVNNVRQEPGVSYTVSSNQLTMSASVASADDFYVIFQGKAKMTATHPPTFDLTAANGTFTGTVTTGGLTVGSDTAKTKFYSNSTYNGIYNGSALTNNESIYMGSGTLFFYSSGGERMRIDSSGNVGIGNASPSSYYSNSNQLVVGSGAARQGITIASSTSTIGQLAFADGTSGDARYEGWVIYDHNTDHMSLGTSAEERMRIDSSGFVGIGTSSPTRTLTVNSGTVNTAFRLESTDAEVTMQFYDGSATSTISGGTSGLIFYPNTTVDEAMRIDSSGNLLVGKTTYGNVAGTGGQIGAGGVSIFTSSNDAPLYLNRTTSEGTIVDLRKDGSLVGSIGSYAGLYTNIGTSEVGLMFNTGAQAIIPHNMSTNATRDNAIDLGQNGIRWKDLWLSGGVYLGGTGAANHLDDYEEGNWTPQFGGSSTTGTGTYSTTVGRYVKVGKKVNCWGIIVSSGTHNGTGTLQIHGLPFTKEYTYLSWGTETNIAYHFGFTSYGTATNVIRLLGPVSNGTFIRFHSFANTGDTSLPPTPANVQSGTSVYFSATYEVQ